MKCGLHITHGWISETPRPPLSDDGTDRKWAVVTCTHLEKSRCKERSLIAELSTLDQSDWLLEESAHKG